MEGLRAYVPGCTVLKTIDPRERTDGRTDLTRSPTGVTSIHPSVGRSVEAHRAPMIDVVISIRTANKPRPDRGEFFLSGASDIFTNVRDRSIYCRAAATAVTSFFFHFTL